jgi:hypothetical protein
MRISVMEHLLAESSSCFCFWLQSALFTSFFPHWRQYQRLVMVESACQALQSFSMSTCCCLFDKIVSGMLVFPSGHYMQFAHHIILPGPMLNPSMIIESILISFVTLYYKLHVLV